jgi:hypothetical protein
MMPNNTAIMIAEGTRTARFVPSGFDLNETLRALANSRQGECRDKNISISLDLIGNVPGATTDETIREVIGTVFNLARNAIQESGGPGDIVLRTELKPGHVVCSIAYSMSAGAARPRAADCFERMDLCACACIVRDHGGELYAWRPRLSNRVTISMDLPVN